MDAIFEGLSPRFWAEFAIFLIILYLVVWPPLLLYRRGLVFENLPRPRSYDWSILCLVAMKAHFNRFYLEMYLMICNVCAIYIHGDLLPLRISFLLILSVFTYHSIFLFTDCFGVAMGQHKWRLACGVSPEELYRLHSCLSVSKSTSVRIFLNSGFFIEERRFGYSIVRTTNCKISIIEWSEGTQGRELLTVLVENRNGGRSFTFPIFPQHLPYIRRIVDVKMNCPGVEDRFVEKFIAHINKNPVKYINHETEPLGPCFACDTNQANVIIKKFCRNEVCTRCACRPLWCVACLARVFAAAKPEDGLWTKWMDGTASCPTCRATFCANDVLLILDDSEL